MTVAKKLLAALQKIEQPGSYWAQATLPRKNFGPITFPLTEKKCRALIELGRPAKFGSGDQTLLDKSVRDVWEIPKSKVKHWYEQVLNKALDQLKEKMGLPNKGRLKAHLHKIKRHYYLQ